MLAELDKRLVSVEEQQSQIVFLLQRLADNAEAAARDAADFARLLASIGKVTASLGLAAGVDLPLIQDWLAALSHKDSPEVLTQAEDRVVAWLQIARLPADGSS